MNTPLTPNEVGELLSCRGQLVEGWLASCLDSVPAQKRLRDAMNYSLLAGGKRLRPMLMNETYRLFGGESPLIRPFMQPSR